MWFYHSVIPTLITRLEQEFKAFTILELKVAQLHKDSGSNRGAQIILVSVSLQQEPEKGSEASLSQALPTLGFALANEATCKSQSHAS